MKKHTLYFAGGCFWGTEHFFKQIPGVIATRTGYANSKFENVDYKLVCTGLTNAAECVEVIFDEERLTIPFLIALFFETIDPTSLNRQGGDTGTQYRTGIYWTDPEDETMIVTTVANLSTNYEKPVVVEVMPLKSFQTAEDYHQDYLDTNPGGYCHIDPALFKMAREAVDPDAPGSLAK